jgi:hypothetical protein
MQEKLRKVLTATTLSVALATSGAAVVTFATAEVAVAKSDKANGGNRGGNGNGNSNASSNRGGASAAEAPGQRTSPGNSGASKAGDSRGNASRSGGTRTTGNGKLFGFLPAHVPEKSRREPVEQSVRSAPRTSVRPQPKASEDVADGNSWKTRLDDGVLDTHPRELGMWNSAKRSPQAVANMVAKYETTGDATGAGGMIGALVSAYDTYNEDKSDYFDALQASVTAGDLSADTATRIFDGTLTQDSFDLDLENFEGDIVLGDDGSITCADGADCSDADLARLQEDADALAYLSSEDGADVAQAAEDFEQASEDRAIADASVQPNFSTDDPEIQEQMLTDVKDLLDIEETETPEFVAPEGDETEPQSDDV